MGNDKPKPPAPKIPAYSDATQVDLGDDLIERTRIAHEPKISKPSTTSPPLAPSSPTQHSSVQDQIDNARIYQTEGMTEEAKRILRKLLISDPANASAKEMLKSIQEQELKRLLEGRGPSSTPPPLKKVRDEGPTGPDEVILELDRDLNLGVIAGDAGRIPDDRELNHFLEDMETALYGSEGKDRIDLGIAYLEMDSPEVAIHQFKAARRIFESQEKVDTAQLRSSIALLAQAYLAARNPLEAYLILQEAIHDGESEVEFCYLMGRACEALRKHDEALFWFAKTKEIAGSYRDVEERLRRK